MKLTLSCTDTWLAARRNLEMPGALQSSEHSWTPDWIWTQPLTPTEASLKTGDMVQRWFPANLTRTMTLGKIRHVKLIAKHQQWARWARIFLLSGAIKLVLEKLEFRQCMVVFILLNKENRFRLFPFLTFFCFVNWVVVNVLLLNHPTETPGAVWLSHLASDTLSLM